MKKNFKIAASICLSIFLFSSCTKGSSSTSSKITYVTDIKPIIVANCTPCHLSEEAIPINGTITFRQKQNSLYS
ncbi:MAG: hypothetical protein IPH28_21090 [Cytophagaceae bacterium]|nr:hypothetical protein [Cytophagaceae bacterium]